MTREFIAQFASANIDGPDQFGRFLAVRTLPPYRTIVRYCIVFSNKNSTAHNVRDGRRKQVREGCVCVRSMMAHVNTQSTGYLPFVIGINNKKGLGTICLISNIFEICNSSRPMNTCNVNTSLNCIGRKKLIDAYRLRNPSTN